MNQRGGIQLITGNSMGEKIGIWMHRQSPLRFEMERRDTHWATTAKNTINTSKVVEAAANVGVSASWMLSHICLGRVVLIPPLTKMATVRSSNEVMNANRNADTRLADIKGKVTVRRRVKVPAPSTRAASSRRQSYCLKA